MPGIASLVLLNFSFLTLKNFNTSIIKVLKDNSSAVLYNKRLGYEIDEELSDGKDYYWMSLNKEDYKNKTAGIQQTLKKLYPKNSEMEVSGSISEKNIDEINALLVK